MHIKPSIGRVVWLYLGGEASRRNSAQPYSASVAYVHNDRLINVGYFDHNGNAKSATSLKLLQEGDTPAFDTEPFACWMPFQVGQAKAQAETKLEANEEPLKA